MSSKDTKTRLLSSSSPISKLAQRSRNVISSKSSLRCFVECMGAVGIAAISYA